MNSTNSALYTVRYSDASGLIYSLPATRFPFPFSVGNVPQYITASGVRTDVVSGRWLVTFIYSLQDDKFGEAIGVVTAPSDFSTYQSAIDYVWTNIQQTFPALNDNEIRPLYKEIRYVRQSGGQAYNVGTKYCALVSKTDLRKNNVQITSGSVATSNIASNVSVTTPNGYTATNQQDLDNEFASKITGIETQISANQLTFASIYGYYNFI